MPVNSGYITRTNLPTSASPLAIQTPPYYIIDGDSSNVADSSTQNGWQPGTSAIKYIWANSPYVAGQQLVLGTPDNTTLILRMYVQGSTQLTMQQNLTTLVTAINQQLVYEVNITTDSASYTYNCYTGTHVEALGGDIAQYGTAIGVPVYLNLPCDPTVITTNGSYV